MTSAKTPPPRIRSAAELMALAHALELEAARRYRSLAERMRLRDEARLADLFEFLAGIEEKHAAHVADRAAEFPGTAASPSIAWEVPENFDEEQGSSWLLTPYRALAIAVRNEDRAFAFYSYVVADAPNDTARALAEALAKDELSHAALLRRERRLAYRHEGGGRRPEPNRIPMTAEEFWALCTEAAWRAAGYYDAVAATLAGQPVAAALGHAAAEEAEDARDAAARIGRNLVEPPRPAVASMEGCLRLLEESFERYADIAERSKDEAVVAAAQRLAERAVRRLSLVRGAHANELLG